MVESVATPHTRLSPATLSHIYHSVCRSSLCYGAEVWSPSDSAIQEMEKADQQISRRIQGLPPTASSPVSSSLLGWDSIEAVFDLAKLMWLWRLMSLPHTSLYQRLATLRLTGCRLLLNQNERHTGPLAAAYSVCLKYELTDALNGLMDSAILKPRTAWKRLCEGTVRAWHESRWRMTRIMYPRLTMFNIAVNSIEIHVWWTVCKVNPRVTKLCKRVIKLMTGETSLNAYRGKHTNRTSCCELCSEHRLEDVAHMLFECETLKHHRDELWTLTLQHVPTGMVESMLLMGSGEKTLFLLSGLRAEYTREWQDSYEAIARFIDSLYKCRSTLLNTRPAV